MRGKKDGGLVKSDSSPKKKKGGGRKRFVTEKKRKKKTGRSLVARFDRNVYRSSKVKGKRSKKKNEHTGGKGEAREEKCHV